MTFAIRSGQPLCFAVLLLVTPSASTAGVPLPPARSMMSYLGMRANCLAAQLPPVPDALARWTARRQVVRRELAAILGLPPREPMRAKVLSSHIEDGVVVEDVMYLWAERAYVSARVMRPIARYGAAPCAGRAAGMARPPGIRRRRQAISSLCLPYGQKGYLLIFVDDPHAGKRAAPCAGLYCAASAAGMPRDGHPGLRHAPRPGLSVDPPRRRSRPHRRGRIVPGLRADVAGRRA